MATITNIARSKYFSIIMQPRSLWWSSLWLAENVFCVHIFLSICVVSMFGLGRHHCCRAKKISISGNKICIYLLLPIYNPNAMIGISIKISKLKTGRIVADYCSIIEWFEIKCRNWKWNEEWIVNIVKRKKLFTIISLLINIRCHGLLCYFMLRIS